MTPNYRIVTYSPQGLTERFKRYLNEVTSQNNNRLNKDDIAEFLLSLFYDANLPFCGAIISWSKNKHFTSLMTTEKLSKLKCLSEVECVSIEGVTLKYGNTYIGFHGFYPLSDVPSSLIENEYKKISFLQNDQKIKEMLTIIYSNVLNSAIEDGNDEGVMIAILANETEIADLKTSEIIDLINE
jgi:hypothetical protein